MALAPAPVITTRGPPTAAANEPLKRKRSAPPPVSISGGPQLPSPALTVPSTNHTFASTTPPSPAKKQKPNPGTPRAPLAPRTANTANPKRRGRPGRPRKDEGDTGFTVFTLKHAGVFGHVEGPTTHAEAPQSMRWRGKVEE